MVHNQFRSVRDQLGSREKPLLSDKDRVRENLRQISDLDKGSAGSQLSWPSGSRVHLEVQINSITTTLHRAHGSISTLDLNANTAKNQHPGEVGAYAAGPINLAVKLICCVSTEQAKA